MSIDQNYRDFAKGVAVQIYGATVETDDFEQLPMICDLIDFREHRVNVPTGMQRDIPREITPNPDDGLLGFLDGFLQAANDAGHKKNAKYIQDYIDSVDK